MPRKIQSMKEYDQQVRSQLGIFVDANVMISMLRKNSEFETQHNHLDILRMVSRARKAILFTSEVTKIEAAKNLAEIDCKIIAPVENPNFRYLLNEMIDVHLPEVDMDELYRQLFIRRSEAIEAATSGGHWECLELTNICLMDIFTQYGQKKGLFADQAKKHQFADAVVFEQIKRRASADFPMFIYSKDKDFERVGRETENIEYAASLPELLALLRMDDNVPETKGFIESHKNLIANDISMKLDTFCSCEANTEEVEPRKFGDRRRIDVKQEASIRFENDIVISGRVTIEAKLLRKCLSIDCPKNHARGWELGGPTYAMDGQDVINAVHVIYVTAVMHDGDRANKNEKTLYGTLYSETDGGSYRIMPAEWKVS